MSPTTLAEDIVRHLLMFYTITSLETGQPETMQNLIDTIAGDIDMAQMVDAEYED